MARRSGSGEAWATGGVVFAATTLVMVGVWQVIMGIAAIGNDELFVVGRDYTYEIDTTAWGWIHLILGALALLAGVYLFTNAPLWARAVGIGIAALSAINQFIFLPYYPLWALTVIALDVFVIWSLATVGSKEPVEFPDDYQPRAEARSGERWPTNRPAAGRTKEPMNSPTTPDTTPSATKAPPLGRQ